MRGKTFTVIALIIAFFYGCESGTLSHKKSDSTKPGRNGQVSLDKVFKIAGDDEEERYFLKRPANLKVDARGNIFILDIDQFLVFDSRGGFQNNLMKKGQGPGELLNISNYLLQEKRILVHDHSPNKIIKMDISGKPEEEFRILANLWIDLFYAVGNKLYFLTTFAEDTGGKGKVIDIEKKLVALSRDKIDQVEEEPEELYVFPVKAFVFKTPSAFLSINLSFLKYCHFKGTLFFFSHAQEYEVKLIDIEKKKIVQTIKRPYKRVKVTKETEKFTPYGQFMFNGKMHRSPRLEYFNDIQSIHFSDDKLWVITSTVDEKKGVKVDRFDPGGEYLDSIYLKFPGMETHYQVEQLTTVLIKGYVYIIERDENENRIIVKYKMN